MDCTLFRNGSNIAVEFRTLLHSQLLNEDRMQVHVIRCLYSLGAYSCMGGYIRKPITCSYSGRLYCMDAYYHTVEPSLVDTNGTYRCVQYSEVSLSQGLLM